MCSGTVAKKDRGSKSTKISFRKLTVIRKKLQWQMHREERTNNNLKTLPEP